MEYQMKLGKNAPDDDSIYWIKFYEGLALEHDPRGYCVCTSEGKDSRVLGRLFRRAGVKHFYAHSITGIDPPELVYFQRRNFAEYREQGYLTYDLMYGKSMWQLMKKNLIPPLRTKRFCCAELKEKRHEITHGCVFSFGVRKAESPRRAKRREEIEITGKEWTLMPFDDAATRGEFENCQTHGEVRVNPIVNWTNEDIWNYSESEQLEQCSLYQEGFHRLGCIGCPMASYADRKKEFERYPGFERAYRRTFNEMYEMRKARGLFVSQNGGDEWFENWARGKSLRGIDDDQLTLDDNEDYNPAHSLLDQLKAATKNNTL